MRTIDLPTHDSSPAGNNLPWSRPSGRIGQGRRPAPGTIGTVVLLALFIALLFGWSPAAFAQGQVEEFVFETKLVRYVLGANGRTISLLDKSSGKERIGDKPTPFAQVRVAGKTWPVTSLQRDGDTLLAKFGGGKVQARYRILARDTHLTVELMAVKGAQPESIELCRLQPAPLQRTGSVLVVKWDEDFALCLMALSERVHSQVMGKDTLAASVYPEFGMVGEEVALIAVPTPTFLDVVQEVEKTYGLPSPTIDGVWAKQSPDVDTNYLFIDVSEETADQVIDYAKMGGFGYVLIPWRSWSTSRGSYPIDRKNFPKGEASLKATIDKFHAAGLKVGMHMMTSLVGKNDPLVRPKPDSRLFKDVQAILGQDISASTTSFAFRDDQINYTSKNLKQEGGLNSSTDIQIGDEILSCKVTDEDLLERFLSCKRGSYGTRRASHKAGTTIYRLHQEVGSFIADLKTSLSDQIADRVAEVFNYCGFDMIYFDGSAKNSIFYPSWFYVGKQQSSIFNRLKRDVLLQGPGINQWSWHIYSRKTCDDHAAIAVKNFLDYHKVKCFKNHRANFMPGEFGWVGLLAGGPDHPATTVEDMDHYGARMIAYDAPISIQTSTEKLKANPDTRIILEKLQKIEALRGGEDIPREQRNLLKTGYWDLFDESGQINFHHIKPERHTDNEELSLSELKDRKARLLFTGEKILPLPVHDGNKFQPGWLICSFRLSDEAATAKDCVNTKFFREKFNQERLLNLEEQQALAVSIIISNRKIDVHPPYSVLNIQLVDAQGWYRDYYIDINFFGEKTLIIPTTNVNRLLSEFLSPAYKAKRALRYFDYSKVAAINLRWMNNPKKNNATASLKKIWAISRKNISN